MVGVKGVERGSQATVDWWRQGSWSDRLELRTTRTTPLNCSRLQVKQHNLACRDGGGDTTLSLGEVECQQYCKAKSSSLYIHQTG